MAIDKELLTVPELQPPTRKITFVIFARRRAAQIDFVARCSLFQKHKLSANVSLCLGGNLEKQSE